MADLQQMSKVLYHHSWVNVEDWAQSIADLADLSDDEIHQLECCSPCVTAEMRPDSNAPTFETPSSPPSLAGRTRHFFATLRVSFRRPLRRAC
ncbi:MAG: hypothetical protein HWD60_13310 [Defluviicoccus sp.]|nr:MAG: hypothetical protein HWD60_13310 [Defluviicoccus sp.]